eukprot:gene14245-biopygen20089
MVDCSHPHHLHARTARAAFRMAARDAAGGGPLWQWRPGAEASAVCTGPAGPARPDRPGPRDPPPVDLLDARGPRRASGWAGRGEDPPVVLAVPPG